MPGLTRKQAEFRTLLKKNTPNNVTEEMKEELDSAEKVIGDNILLNSFNVDRRSLVVTDAS